MMLFTGYIFREVKSELFTQRALGLSMNNLIKQLLGRNNYFVC